MVLSRGDTQRAGKTPPMLPLILLPVLLTLLLPVACSDAQEGGGSGQTLSSHTPLGTEAVPVAIETAGGDHEGDAPGGATPSDRPPAAISATEPVTITFYHGLDCEHCAEERPFLAGLQTKYPSLVVDDYEVWNDEENLDRLRAHADEMGFTAAGTPVTILGDLYWVGFDEAIARSIEAAVAAATSGRTLDTTDTAVIDIPLFGEFDVAHSSLIVGALIIGFIDGVNPCSLWVLTVLLAIVLHSGSRGRVMSVGFTFLIVTAGMYALYMTGIYSALDYIGQMSWIRRVIAVVALIFGLIHLKDYFWFKRGPSLSIDDARKPGLYKRMRSVADMDRSLPAVLGGTVVLAVGVSLLETPCTAGLPLLWANVLASQGVAFGTAVALFGVYMAVFLLDELVVFGAAVVTLRAAKVQEQHGRLLKLVSGALMVTLALAMAMVPATLESVEGTVQVFVVAAAVAAALWAVGWVAAVMRRSSDANGAEGSSAASDDG